MDIINYTTDWIDHIHGDGSGRNAEQPVLKCNWPNDPMLYEYCGTTKVRPLDSMSRPQYE